MTTLYVDNIAPNLQSKISAPNLTLPTGSVVQVVEGDVTSAGDFNSTSWANRISLNITAKSATSKIIGFYTAGDCRTSNHTAAYGGTRVQRDGTTVQQLTREVNRNSGINDLWTSLGLSFADSISGLGTTYTYTFNMLM